MNTTYFIKLRNPIKIINTINNFDSNKATGPYIIPNEMLRLIKTNIAEPLR